VYPYSVSTECCTTKTRSPIDC